MAKIYILQHHPVEDLANIADALEGAALAWQYVRVDKGQSVPASMKGAGGLIVFSRILADQEVVVVANTGPSGFTGRILVDYDLSQSARTFTMGYSNLTAFATAPPATTSIAAGQIYGDSGPVATQIASLPVSVASREVQIWVPS